MAFLKNFAEVVAGILCFKARERCVVRACAVADGLPSKEGAHLPQGLPLVVAKHDDALRVEEHDDVVAIAPKSHQPFRTIDARSRAPRLLFSLARGRAGDGRNHDAGRD